MKERTGALLSPLQKENDTTKGPCNPPPCTPSSGYLVFSSFTRITLQKPRSIMLLWKRDS